MCAVMISPSLQHFRSVVLHRSQVARLSARSVSMVNHYHSITRMTSSNSFTLFSKSVPRAQSHSSLCATNKSTTAFLLDLRRPSRSNSTPTTTTACIKYAILILYMRTLFDTVVLQAFWLVHDIRTLSHGQMIRPISKRCTGAGLARRVRFTHSRQLPAP